MANTISSIVNTVVGDKRLWAGYVTCDATATSVVVPGASAVDAILACHAVSSGGCGVVASGMNVGPAATAALGSVAMTNTVNGGKYLLTVLYH